MSTTPSVESLQVRALRKRMERRKAEEAEQARRRAAEEEADCLELEKLQREAEEAERRAQEEREAAEKKAREEAERAGRKVEERRRAEQQAEEPEVEEVSGAAEMPKVPARSSCVRCLKWRVACEPQTGKKKSSACRECARNRTSCRLPGETEASKRKRKGSVIEEESGRRRKQRRVIEESEDEEDEEEEEEEPAQLAEASGLVSALNAGFPAVADELHKQTQVILGMKREVRRLCQDLVKMNKVPEVTEEDAEENAEDEEAEEEGPEEEVENTEGTEKSGEAEE
jgi:hypothetical protein